MQLIKTLKNYAVVLIEKGRWIKYLMRPTVTIITLIDIPREFCAINIEYYLFNLMRACVYLFSFNKYNSECGLKMSLRLL